MFVIVLFSVDFCSKFCNVCNRSDIHLKFQQALSFYMMILQLMIAVMTHLARFDE